NRSRGRSSPGRREGLRPAGSEAESSLPSSRRGAPAPTPPSSAGVIRGAPTGLSGEKPAANG
ncbi:hypothetical protein COS12_01140, partial [Candidatus Roizmanbacteria bacterium CG01_land_8_20_14_3_00_33_9]